MHMLLDETRACFDAGIFAPALLTCLAVIDAAGAVEYPKSRNGARFKQWYEKYVLQDGVQLGLTSAANLWKVRNGFLHETTLLVDSDPLDRTIFQVDNHSLISGISFYDPFITGQKADIINLNLFINCVTQGAKRWLHEIANDGSKSGRLNGLVQYRPNGLPGLLGGAAIIA